MTKKKIFQNKQIQDPIKKHQCFEDFKKKSFEHIFKNKGIKEKRRLAYG